jgi:hypothetical protein
MRNCCELHELGPHVVVLAEADEGALVAHLVAVVGSTENGDTLSIVLHHISFILNLVRAHDQLQVVGAEEVLGDVGAESKSHASLAGTPSRLGLGVCDVINNNKNNMSALKNLKMHIVLLFLLSAHSLTGPEQVGHESRLGGFPVPP